jgi:hypothetical protein
MVAGWRVGRVRSNGRNWKTEMIERKIVHAS